MDEKSKLFARNLSTLINYRGSISTQTCRDIRMQ